MQALDARTGDLRWEYSRSLPEGMSNMTRNLAIYEDKIFINHIRCIPIRNQITII